MKYLKVLVIAIVAMFAVEGAKAQVVVKARIGAPAPRRVVVARPVAPRRVVVSRPVYRRHYYRRPVVVARPAYYHRPYRRAVVVRHY